MLRINGKKINPGMQLKISTGPKATDYIILPPGHLRPSNYAQYGVIEVADPVRPDDRYFIVTDNDDGTYSSVPRPALSLRPQKLTEINAACAAAITAGFTSSALGAPHTYQSQLEDQLNLVGAAAMGVTVSYRCTDVNGVYAARPHTAAQIKQVLADGAQVKLNMLAQATSLKAQVEEAETAEEMTAIVWSA